MKPITKFPFRIGSIESGSREKGASRYAFPFRIGSIESGPPHGTPHGPPFPFRIGSIESWFSRVTIQLLLGFHSVSVRLNLGSS